MAVKSIRASCKGMAEGGATTGPERLPVFVFKDGVWVVGGKPLRLAPFEAFVLGVLVKSAGSVVLMDAFPAISVACGHPWKAVPKCVESTVCRVRRSLRCAGLGREVIERVAGGYVLHGTAEGELASKPPESICVEEAPAGSSEFERHLQEIVERFHARRRTRFEQLLCAINDYSKAAAQAQSARP